MSLFHGTRLPGVLEKLLQTTRPRPNEQAIARGKCRMRQYNYYNFTMCVHETRSGLETTKSILTTKLPMPHLS